MKKKKQNALRKRKIKADKEKDEEKIAMASIDVFKVCVHWKKIFKIRNTFHCFLGGKKF